MVIAGLATIVTASGPACTVIDPFEAGWIVRLHVVLATTTWCTRVSVFDQVTVSPTLIVTSRGTNPVGEMTMSLSAVAAEETATRAAAATIARTFDRCIGTSSPN